jgi:hypothetical protein
MHIHEFTTLLSDLRADINPLTGEVGATGSCLRSPVIRKGLDDLLGVLSAPASPPYRSTFAEKDAPGPTATEIEELCNGLRDLGFRPTREQLAKVFLGSRSIADDRLRGLPAYRRYRGVVTRQRIREILTSYRELIEGTADKPGKTKGKEAFEQVDFFDTAGFDKLSERKAEELRMEVEQLGLRKVAERLPAYMARARQRLPRAFEPWTREEQALLIEAMCYTNDGDRLSGLFGRSVKSVRRMGEQLIRNSRSRSEQ